jgi:hypothetical protein
MDLIDDLGTDLAVAILVERRLDHRLDESAARSLIGRVRNALVPLSDGGKAAEESFEIAANTGSGL